MKDGFTSYVKGVGWGVSALASRAGLLGDVAKEEAMETNGRLGEAWGQIKAHPGQAALAVGAAVVKYPVQFASRMGTGAAVSYGFSPYAGIPSTAIAMYGSAFEAAYEHPDIIAATVFCWGDLRRRNCAMSSLWTIRPVCPMCGATQQPVGLFVCLRRRCRITCSSCGRNLESRLSSATYALFCLYISIIVAVTGVPIIFALAARDWLVAVLAMVVLLLLIVPPSMVLHARGMQVRR